MPTINAKINIGCDGEPPIWQKIKIEIWNVGKRNDYPKKYKFIIFDPENDCLAPHEWFSRWQLADIIKKHLHFKNKTIEDVEIYAADGGDPLAGDGINEGIALIVAL